MVRDSASQLGKGFGFVQLSDQAAARAALGCDGQPLRKRPIRVTRAVKVPAHLRDMGKAKPGKGGLMGRDAAKRESPAGWWCTQIVVQAGSGVLLAAELLRCDGMRPAQQFWGCSCGREVTFDLTDVR